MRRVARVVPALVLGLTLALALSGCIHEDRSVSLNGDGSGTYTLALGLSDQLLALANDQFSAGMDQVGAQIRQDGGTFSKHDDGSYTVWTFARPFKSIADLNTLLQQPLTTGTTGGTSSAASAPSTDSFHVSESSGFFTNSFRVTGHMSMLSSASQPSNSGGGVNVAQLLKDMRESFAISLPGWISAHSGGSLSGNTVTYTVHYGQQTSIDVSASALNGAGIASIAGGVLLLLIVGGVALLLTLRRRAAVAITTPVPVAVVAPYSPHSAPAYASDTPTITSLYAGPDAPTVDQPYSNLISPDAPTEQD